MSRIRSTGLNLQDQPIISGFSLLQRNRLRTFPVNFSWNTGMLYLSMYGITYLMHLNMSYQSTLLRGIWPRPRLYFLISPCQKMGLLWYTLSLQYTEGGKPVYWAILWSPHIPWPSLSWPTLEPGEGGAACSQGVPIFLFFSSEFCFHKASTGTVGQVLLKASSSIVPYTRTFEGFVSNLIFL